MPLIPLLSAGNFVIGMGAFVVIGVMNPIRDSFDISSSDAGLILTIYALAYAIGSPLGVALTGRWSRRTVLLSGAALFGFAALGSALAPSLSTLLVFRVLAAFGAGLFTPVSASVAFASSEPGQQGRSLARVFFGLTLAQVIGVPIGSFLGYTFGWQAAFAVVALLSALLLIALMRAVPAALPFQINNLSTLGAALLDWRSLLSVLYTASFLAAIYVLYTYLAPLLQQQMGYERNGVTIILVLFGTGAVLGNLWGGKLTDSLGPYRTLRNLCGAQILILPLFSLLPMPVAALWVTTLAWSVCGWSFMVAQQTRLVQQTPERQSVVLALNAAAIYVGAALGGAMGGQVIDIFGIQWLGVAASAGAALALFHLIASDRAALSRPATVG